MVEKKNREWNQKNKIEENERVITKLNLDE